MLSAKYREFLTPSRCETLSELIDCARDQELELKRQVERGEKRSLEKDAGSSKNAKFSSSSNNSSISKDARSCSKCGKKHGGACWMDSKTCFKCGKAGHLATQCTSSLSLCYNCYKSGHRKNECPELKMSGSSNSQVSGKKVEAVKPKGRAFQMTAEEAKTTSDVVTGTFSINSLSAYVLFDSGASRSFKSIKFACHSSFVLDKLPEPLEVEVADSKTFLVMDVYRNCKLTIDGEDYLVDLLPMTLGEFDVVIGMDWLSTYRANIVCNRKIIQLVSPSGHEVCIQGGKTWRYCFVLVSESYEVHEQRRSVLSSVCY